MDHFQHLLEQTLVPFLNIILTPIHGLFDAAPSWVWRISVCLLLVLGTAWTFRLSKESIFRGAPTQTRRCDLRLWVGLLIVPYLFIYLVF